MTIFLTVLHIIVSFVLIVVILIQGGRGQGLSGPSFSSGNVQSLFGTQAADFLTKATSVAAICFLFTCLALNFIEIRKSKSILGDMRHNAPVDVEAVKKALEKIKSEQATSTTSDKAKKEVASLLDNAQKTASNTADSAKTAVSQMKADAAQTTSSASAAVSDAAKTVQETAHSASANVKQ